MLAKNTSLSMTVLCRSNAALMLHAADLRHILGAHIKICSITDDTAVMKRLYSMFSVFPVSLGIIQLSGCASTGHSGTEVKISQDLYITEGSSPKVMHKQGDSVPLADQPLLLESPGHVGILVVPMQGKPSELQPHLKPIDEWSGDVLDYTLNFKLNDIVQETSSIQMLLASRKTKDAYAKIELLQLKYPRVTSLNFLRASALLMMGEREKAKAALEIGLKDFPDYPNARHLYQVLGGEVPNPTRKPSSEGHPTL